MTRPTCAAKTCYNSYFNKPLIKFFPFPNDEVRSRQWIKNSGREDLFDEPLEKLPKKYFLCSAHFEDKWFLNPKFKTKFKKYVEPVPTIFLNNFTEFLPKSIQNKISSKMVHFEKNAVEVVKKELTENMIEEKEKILKDSDLDLHVNLNNDNLLTELILCRLCASDISSDQYKNIFLEGNKSLKEMIEYLLPEKVTEDELPHYICYVCELKVKDCVDAILFFEEVYNYLKGITEDERLLGVNSDGLEVDDNFDKFENDKIDCHLRCEGAVAGPKSKSEFLHSEEIILESPKSNEKYNKYVMTKCSFCTAEFNSRFLLKSHERQVHLSSQSEHDKIRQAKCVLSKCSKCNKMFTAARLKKHMASHLPKENQCEYCGIQYKTKKRLQIHLSTHEGDPFCSFCGKEFSNSAQKRLHEKTHTDGPGLLCDICGRLFSEQRILDNHIKNHYKAGEFTCRICNKSFKTEKELKVHEDSKTSKFSCPICGKEFHLKARVQQHLLTHSDICPFTCFCGVSFNRSGNLTQHLKQKHSEVDENENIELFKCEVCNRKLKSKLKLKWHLAKHVGDKKPYDCELCDKKYASIAKYKNHMRTHTGERPFACTFCSRTFSSQANMKQHELIHRDVYPHRCTICDRVFKRIQSLTIHKRTHTGERPFTCLICQKGFLQKYDLRKHLKTHNKQPKNIELPDNLLQSKEIAIPELSTVNVVPPITSTSLQLFSVDDIPQLTLTSADLQILNVPIVEIQPLVQLSANV